MARRPECYVDTSAFIALLDRSDTHHPLFRRLFADPPKLICSSLVVAETHGWFLRRYDQIKALQFLNFLSLLTVLHVEPFGSDEIRKVLGIVRRYADQTLTLADAHGLVLMAEHKVLKCWSTDRHLGLSGVPLVI